MQTNKLTEQFQEYLKLSADLRPDYIASLGKGDNEAKITAIFPEAPELLKAFIAQFQVQAVRKKNQV